MRQTIQVSFVFVSWFPAKGVNSSGGGGISKSFEVYFWYLWLVVMRFSFQLFLFICVVSFIFISFFCHLCFLFLDSDSVFVHIINSEKHAAMQHELASRLHIPRSLLVILTFFYVSKKNIYKK